MEIYEHMHNRRPRGPSFGPYPPHQGMAFQPHPEERMLPRGNSHFPRGRRSGPFPHDLPLGFYPGDMGPRFGPTPDMMFPPSMVTHQHLTMPPIPPGHPPPPHMLLPPQGMPHPHPMSLSPPPRRRLSMTKGEWIPLTKLGRLVKDMKIKSLEEVFLFDLPILEPEIFDHFLGISIKEEVLAVVPTDKSLPTGERCVRFKALAVAGDCNGHVGLGVQISKEVTVAIAGACLAAKLNIIPIRRGYWGRPQSLQTQAVVDRPHTLPHKVNGAFGNVTVRVVPAPRGAGCGSAPLVAQKVLLLAGVEDAYFISPSTTRDLGFLCKATLRALGETFSLLQEEVFRVTRASQHLGMPEQMALESMFGQMNLGNMGMWDNRSFPPPLNDTHGEMEDTENNRLMLEAQIHRDLGLNLPTTSAASRGPPMPSFDPMGFDGGFHPPPHLMHHMHHLNHLTKPFIPSSKRGPQLAPIPTRKRSLIPIVAPPPEDEQVGGIDLNSSESDVIVEEDMTPLASLSDSFTYPTASYPTGGEVCLELRPRSVSAAQEMESDLEERSATPTIVVGDDAEAWKKLAPVFKPQQPLDASLKQTSQQIVSDAMAHAVAVLRESHLAPNVDKEGD